MEKTIKKYIEKGHPCEWFIISDELFHATEVLYEDATKSFIEQNNSRGIRIRKPSVSRGYILLAGYTIENLLKSLLIVENPQLIKSGKIETKISKGHNLKDLSEKITSLKFSKNEIELLNLFSEALPYWSRYPIPKYWEKLSEEKYLNKNLHNRFNKLYHKLRKEIYFKTRLGWIGPNNELTGEWYNSEYDTDLSFKDYQEDIINYRSIRREKIAEKSKK